MKKIKKKNPDLFKLRKEINDNTITEVRNLFRLKKENEAMQDRIIRDIRNLFEQEKEDCYKLVRNYIEYESNGDRNKTLSIEEYGCMLLSCLVHVSEWIYTQ